MGDARVSGLKPDPGSMPEPGPKPEAQASPVKAEETIEVLDVADTPRARERAIEAFKKNISDGM